jgi:predicted molibdopterin-dependent oxidoreductase YjgC
VRVRSRRGAVTAPIKVGDVVPRGVVFVPFHFGDLGEDSAANNLTSTLEDPVSKPTQSSSEQQPARKAWAALQSPCSPSRL